MQTWSPSSTYLPGTQVIFDDDIYEATSPVVGQDPSKGGWKIIVGSNDAVAAVNYVLPRLSLSGVEYGILPNGTDMSQELQAAVTALGAIGGGDIWLDAGTYVFGSTITMANNVRIYGNESAKPQLNLVSATDTDLFDFTGVTGAYLENLRLDGAGAQTSGPFITLADAINNKIFQCDFSNTPDNTLEGSVRISGTSSGNVIEGCTSTGCLGSFIGLTGASTRRNIIRENFVTDAIGFGIVLGDSANSNEISGNRTYSNGIELVGIKESCFLNRVENNHAEGCGDNGISVSGYDNVVVGNICSTNQRAGIWVWGSGNVITGNHCRNNNQVGGGAQWAGIGVSANFGGTGQHNVICGNVAEDTQAVQTQFNAIRIGNSGYTLWAAGQVITQGTYRYYGLNVYIATNSATTGATPPTHTSGVVSDGAVSWRYVRTFTTTVAPVFNQVFGNRTIGGTSAIIVDASGADGNFFLDQNLTKMEIATGNVTLGAPSGSVLFVSINGTDQVRFDNNVFRPETDNSYALGLTNRRWSNIHSNAYSAGASGSTVQVVGARRTGWTAPTGTPTRTGYATGTATTTQLAETLKALIDDLITHGLIGT